MPIKNGLFFLPASRQSILENARAFDEIVIVDDGSTDGSYDFCHLWAEEDSRVKIIKNPKSGLVSALNSGIQASSNSFIARFDVDDTYRSFRLEKQILQLKPDDVAIFSDYNVVDSKSTYLGSFPSAIFSHAVSVSLIKSRRTPHPSVVFRREAALEVGGYRDEDYLVEDLSLWLRLSRYGNLVSVPEVLLDYRMSPGGVSSVNRNQMISAKRRVIQAIGINPPDIRKSLEYLRETLDSYDSYESSTHRDFFHLTDLLTCLESQQSTKSKVNEYFNLITRLCRIKFLKTSATLAADKYRRDSIRKISNNIITTKTI